jgi:hypothetical protein
MRKIFGTPVFKFTVKEQPYILDWTLDHNKQICPEQLPFSPGPLNETQQN